MSVVRFTKEKTPVYKFLSSHAVAAMQINDTFVPDDERIDLIDFIERGIMPEETTRLAAVLEDSLHKTVSFSFGAGGVDESSRMIRWIYNYAPIECWGSRGKMLNWSKKVKNS